MTTSKARQYYVSEETRAELRKIGNGNYSKGIRISAAYHERLVARLEEIAKLQKEYKGNATETHINLDDLCYDVRDLLAEIEGAGK